MACSNIWGTFACETTSIATSIITLQVTTVYQTTLTTTQQIVTTCKATVGETVMITPPQIWSQSLQSGSNTIALSPSTPSTVISNTAPTSNTSPRLSTATLTVTELAIIMEDANGQNFATSILTLPQATGAITLGAYPSTYTVVIGQDQGDGWDTWSDGAKGGLIAGCILAFMFLVGLFCCFLSRNRRTQWVQHHWW